MKSIGHFGLKILQGLRHRAIQVVLVLGVYLLVANILPPDVHRGLYTLSVFIKDLLIWMLPLTIGFFIAHTICSFERKAPVFIIMLIVFEALSNFSCVCYAFVSGSIAAEFSPQILLSTVNHDFSALWKLPFTKPEWWSADKGTLAGLLLGCISALINNDRLSQIVHQGKAKAEWILVNIFSRLIPLFVLGFVARMHQTQLLSQLFGKYGVLLLWLALFLVGYLIFLFIISSDFSSKGIVRVIKNLLPAGVIAFTSGCSLSTMPWTIAGAGKNLQNPSFAKAVIPATTNIQQIGDCIANTFLCFLIYRHFFGHNPDLATWMNFSVVFVLARFATAAMLGGAIFIMLPIYEAYLGFNAEMIAIILAFNVLLDPFITSSNVLANGALCRVFEKIWIGVNKSLQVRKNLSQ